MAPAQPPHPPPSPQQRRSSAAAQNDNSLLTCTAATALVLLCLGVTVIAAGVIVPGTVSSKLRQGVRRHKTHVARTCMHVHAGPRQTHMLTSAICLSAHVCYACALHQTMQIWESVVWSPNSPPETDGEATQCSCMYSSYVGSVSGPPWRHTARCVVAATHTATHSVKRAAADTRLLCCICFPPSLLPLLPSPTPTRSTTDHHSAVQGRPVRRCCPC